jgi:uncharacterized protein (TIGR03435 family)
MQSSHWLGSCRNAISNAAKFTLLTLSIGFALASATVLRAQSQAQPVAAVAPAIVFEYDVASIKLNKSTSGSFGSRSSPDGITLTNVPLQTLIQSAFGIQNYQIIAAPDWLAAEHYDIEAKMDQAVADALQKLNPDDRRLKRQLMLQALLIDRLKLISHHEIKELPIYSLVIAKNGPKIQETKPDPATPGVPVRRGGPSIRTSRTGSGPITLTVLHCASEDLASVFVPHVGRTVLDKTGLTAVYDFTLQFTPDDSTAVPTTGAGPSTSDPTAPSIFTAVQEQLGLKLESGKGPVELTVIDHVERPSGN